MKNKTFGLIIGLLLMALAACTAQQDVAFARKAFSSLMKGHYSVRKHIDWESLIMLDQNVGNTYRTIGNKGKRELFQRVFIQNVGHGFRRSKGQLKQFYNWRVFKRLEDKGVIVTANCHDERMTLYFYIKTKDGKRKLAEVIAAHVPAGGEDVLGDKK